MYTMKYFVDVSLRYLGWISSAVFLALSFPPNGIPFLGLVALIPAIYRSYKDGYISTLVGALIFSIVFWASTVDWFSSFHPLAPVGILIPLTLYTTFPFVVFSSVSKNFSENGILFFPFLWVGTEFLRGNGFWSLPLIYLAHTQYHFALSNNYLFSALNGAIPSLAQSFGVFGVSFIVALFNCLILIFFLKIFSKKLPLNLPAVRVVIVIISIVIVSSLLYLPSEIASHSLPVSLGILGVLIIVTLTLARWKTTKGILLETLREYYPVIITVGVLVTGATIFIYSDNAYRTSNASRVKFALLQPNYSPWEKLLAKDLEKLHEVIELYRRASHSSDVIVGCESILRDPVNVYYERNDWFGIKAMNIAKELRKPIILSYPHMETFVTNTFIISGGRVREIIQEVHEYYNSALFFDNEGKPIARYDKVHTVPFGEWTPYSEYIPPLRETILAIVGSDLTPGKSFMVIPVEVRPSVVINMAPIICFEDLYPYITRKLKNMGADVLINMTNDGWANSVKSQWQHLVGAMYRAIETGLPLVRATNTGRTAIILPHGKIITTIDDFTKGIMVEEVKLFKLKTFFTTYGDSVFFSFLLLGNLLVFLSPLLRKWLPN